MGGVGLGGGECSLNNKSLGDANLPLTIWCEAAAIAVEVVHGNSNTWAISKNYNWKGLGLFWSYKKYIIILMHLI